MKSVYHLNNIKISAIKFGGLTRIVLIFCMANCLLFSFTTISQTSVPVSIETTPIHYKVWAEVINGDTVPSIRLQDVWVYAEYNYKNKKQYEAWSRTKYNVKKVYPYAILAAAKLKEYNRVLEKMPDESTRKVYIKRVEKELKAEFEEPLKNLTITQGKILLKLIDRETGNSSYELVIEVFTQSNAISILTIAFK